MEKIEHLEFLSKLKFADEDREKFAQEFDKILSFVDEIAALDLPESLEKDEPIGLDQLRDDQPQPSMAQAEVLQNAPKQKDGCYVTPMVVE